MHAQRINRVSIWAAWFFSLMALLTVATGYFQPPQADEGTAAHIFQICIVLLFPAILLFLATADWRRPWRSIRAMTLPASLLVVAFAALYYLEHYR